MSVSPCFIPAFEYPDGIAITAELLADSLSVKLYFSIAIIAVKIFVVLAGYNFSSSFLLNKIFPVEVSINKAASDAISKS